MERPKQMSKNLLLLSGSPRRGGNSDLLCGQFAAGARRAKKQVEKIFLRDHKINYCLGCYACEGKGRCVQKDDMAEIREKMIAADVIVMATPVYFYTMDAQMKSLIDRTVPRYTEIRDKEMYIILAAADTDKQAMERTIEGFRGFFSCLDGIREKGIVYGIGAWRIGDIQTNSAMAAAYQMGKNA